MGEEISQPYFQIQHSNDIEALNVNINLLNEQFYKEVSVFLWPADFSRLSVLFRPAEHSERRADELAA
jgi:hypothetical protein